MKPEGVMFALLALGSVVVAAVVFNLIDSRRID